MNAGLAALLGVAGGVVLTLVVLSIVVSLRVAELKFKNTLDDELDPRPAERTDP